MPTLRLGQTQSPNQFVQPDPIQAGIQYNANQSWLQQNQNNRYDPAYAGLYGMNPAQAPQQAPLGNNSPLQGMSVQYPTYQNPLEQKLAVASGVINPYFTDPRAALEHQTDQRLQLMQAQHTQQVNDEAAQAATLAHSAYAPQYDGSGKLVNPDQFLTTQLAGDPTGTATKVLHSMQNTTVGQPVQPYLPNGGYGKQDDALSVMNPLDHTIYNDPTFQQELVRNPDRAHFAYQKLTGRDFTSDYTANQAFVKQQYNTGFQATSDALKNGAVFDPIKRTWKVWQMAPAPDDPNSIKSLTGAQPQASRQLVDATDTENNWYNTHYQNVTGKPLASAPQSISGFTNSFKSDPDVAKALAAASTAKGSSLTQQQERAVTTIALGKKADQQAQLESNYQQGWGMVPKAILATRDALSGYKVGHFGEPDSPETRNFLGQTMDALRNPYDQLFHSFGSGITSTFDLPPNVPGPTVAPRSRLTPAQQASIMATK